MTSFWDELQGPIPAVFINTTTANGTYNVSDWTLNPTWSGDQGNLTLAPSHVTPILSQFMIGAYITLSVLIAVLNTLTITAILSCPELKNVTNMFVLSLSSADLLLAPTLILVNFLSHAPMSIGPLGARIFATVLLSIMFTSSGVSLFSILAIAVDRYFAVLHPYNYKQIMTPRRATVLILGIWFYCVVFVFALTAYYISQTKPSVFLSLSLLSVILPLPVYLGAIISQIVICLVASVALYVKIFLAVRKRHQASLSLRGRNPLTETVESRRVTNTMALVLGALIVSWMPYTMLSITVTQEFVTEHDWFTYVAMAAILLLYANSFMNPLIYAAHSTAFRQAYWHLICTLCGIVAKDNGRIRQDTPNVSAVVSSKDSRDYTVVETTANGHNNITMVTEL